MSSLNETPNDKGFDMMHRGVMFPGIRVKRLATYLIVIHLLILAVSGQECTVTVGSLSHDDINNIVTLDQTFILAGYTVPCSGTVVAWEFCYKVQRTTSVTFYPGIWRITGTMGSNTDYTLVQSNTVTYDPSVRDSQDSFNVGCQIFNLSDTDQFTAPAGSVVGLYSNVGTTLLHTNTDNLITTYQIRENQNSVTITGSSNDVDYNIAVRILLVVSTSDTTSMVPTTTTTTTTTTSTVIATTTTTSIVPTSDTVTAVTSTTPMVTDTVTAVGAGGSSDSGGSSVGIIAGAVIGVIFCITILLLVVILLWCYSRRRKGKPNITTQGIQNLELTAAKCDISEKSTTATTDSSNYYSSIEHRPTIKDGSDVVYKNTVISEYEAPSNYEDDNGCKEALIGKSDSRFAGNDYEAILHHSEYASAVHVYSNSVRESTAYDDSLISEYSEVGNSDEATINDEEEIYSDPGYCKEDIYACFEKKKFHMIKRNDVSISQKLGSGEFGTVHLGMWTKSPTDKVQVAVKTLNSQCSESDRVKFLREAAIMGQFVHNNVVQLHGVVTEEENMMIVLEYMLKGDLRDNLLDIKNNIDEYRSLPVKLLNFCRQIAAGMNYLANKQFVHRDLAARNILVSSDDVCKIADFGMARDVGDDIYYIATGGKIPLKWTAPEAIYFKKFSAQSDVWSFGCVMYEIWSLGHKPSEDLDGIEYLEKITTGYRLPPPPGCPRAVYELMIQCWHPTAKNRPLPGVVLQTLQKSDRALLTSSVQVTDDDVTSESQSMMLGAPLAAGSQLYLDLQQRYTTV